MTESTAVIPALVIRRIYDAPRERVYAAWTDPELAARFLGPGDTRAAEIAMDVRPGGSYRIVMISPDGSRMPVGGIYREVRPPQRLVMTWRWEEDDPREERDTLLTLEFLEHDGKTEFILTHELLASLDSRDRHAHGWNLILDELAVSLR